ncbi:unnamed protein product [Symbiodinium natans]|uniref:Uncharacterized protein n=1 Tax=Symbiodinium natans TaxID=878477 RepID=A0A812M466_9DINO|nr:unnamed protein product [Symbiodinium natans]
MEAESNNMTAGPKQPRLRTGSVRSTLLESNAGTGLSSCAGLFDGRRASRGTLSAGSTKEPGFPHPVTKTGASSQTIDRKGDNGPDVTAQNAGTTASGREKLCTSKEESSVVKPDAGTMLANLLKLFKGTGKSSVASSGASATAPERMQPWHGRAGPIQAELRESVSGPG